MSSWRSRSRFAGNSLDIEVIPVTFPPGRAKVSASSELDWVRTVRGHAGNSACCLLRRERGRVARCHQYVNLGGNKFAAYALEAAHLSVSPSRVTDDPLPLP